MSWSLAIFTCVDKYLYQPAQYYSWFKPLSLAIVEIDTEANFRNCISASTTMARIRVAIIGLSSQTGDISASPGDGWAARSSTHHTPAFDHCSRLPVLISHISRLLRNTRSLLCATLARNRRRQPCRNMAFQQAQEPMDHQEISPKILMSTW